MGSTKMVGAGDEEVLGRNVKIIFLFVLCIVTTFFCFLPKIILYYSSRRKDVTMDRQQARKMRRRKRMKKVILSLTNCFASGVFLGVCLLDLLPEVEQNFDDFFKTFPDIPGGFPLPQFCVVLGFLVLLSIEQVVNMCRKGDHHFHSHAHPAGPESLLSSTASTIPPSRGDIEPIIHHYHHHHSNLPINYRPDIDVERQQQISEHIKEELHSTPAVIGHESHVVSEATHLLQGSTSIPRCASNEDEEEKEEMTNIIEDLEEAEIERTEVPTDPAAHSQVRYVMLAVALSIHSVFEGLALGLVEKLNSIIQLFAAIAIHKCIVAFSFGFNIAQSDLSKLSQLISMLVFSLASPVGTALGLGVEMVQFDGGLAGIVIGSLQGLACGSFIYVVFFELLPHEFFTHKKRPNPLVKVLSLVAGVTLMSIIMMLAPV